MKPTFSGVPLLSMSIISNHATALGVAFTPRAPSPSETPRFALRPGRRLVSPIIQPLTSFVSIFAIGFAAAGVCADSEAFLPQEAMITAMSARATNSRNFFIEPSPDVGSLSSSPLRGGTLSHLEDALAPDLIYVVDLCARTSDRSGSSADRRGCSY